MKALGIYIKEKMESEPKPMTRQELAERSGIPYTTLGRILEGTNEEPKPSHIARLAKVFKDDFWKLMERAGYPAYVHKSNAKVLRLASIMEAEPGLVEIMDHYLESDLKDRQWLLDLLRSRRRPTP